MVFGDGEGREEVSYTSGFLRHGRAPLVVVEGVQCVLLRWWTNTRRGALACDRLERVGIYLAQDETEGERSGDRCHTTPPILVIHSNFLQVTPSVAIVDILGA